MGNKTEKTSQFTLRFQWAKESYSMSYNYNEYDFVLMLQWWGSLLEVTVQSAEVMNAQSDR